MHVPRKVGHPALSTYYITNLFAYEAKQAKRRYTDMSNHLSMNSSEGFTDRLKRLCGAMEWKLEGEVEQSCFLNLMLDSLDPLIPALTKLVSQAVILHAQ